MKYIQIISAILITAGIMIAGSSYAVTTGIRATEVVAPVQENPTIRIISTPSVSKVSKKTNSKESAILPKVLTIEERVAALEDRITNLELKN